MAVTRAGGRLGHGKGFYDKFLAEHSALFPHSRPPLKVALCLNEQLVEQLPLDPTDVPIDLILCEDGEFSTSPLNSTP